MNDTKPATRQQGTQRPARNAAGEMPIPVFYSPAMVAEIGSFSPSAGKPALVVESWQFLGLPLQFHAPQPLSAEQFGVAHDPDFVADVLGCRRSNGFGDKSPAVAAALPWTNGAMLSAAREALSNGLGAIAPCSGFHHAGYDHAGGLLHLQWPDGDRRRPARRRAREQGRHPRLRRALGQRHARHHRAPAAERGGRALQPLLRIRAPAQGRGVPRPDSETARAVQRTATWCSTRPGPTRTSTIRSAAG